MTPDEYAQAQLKAAADALPQCGHMECMNEAVVQLSWALVMKVGTEIPASTMSTKLIMLIASLSSAHEKLGAMRRLSEAAGRGTMQ
jgi:hypothetical protein